jgi:two-component system response regulator RegX3
MVSFICFSYSRFSTVLLAYCLPFLHGNRLNGYGYLKQNHRTKDIFLYSSKIFLHRFSTRLSNIHSVFLAGSKLAICLRSKINACDLQVFFLVNSVQNRKKGLNFMVQVEEGKILIVDDDPYILEMLKFVLEKENFVSLYTAESGNEALRICQEVSPDLIILDVMLPDLDGMDVCKKIRQFSNAPILFLTAKNTDADKLTGFIYGGDDYITKPFNPLEVTARIRVHLRRQLMLSEAAEPVHQIYDFGYFQLNETSGQLIVDGKEMSCPAKEFQLLLFFCQHLNQVFSSRQLYRQVWDETFDLGGENTVKVHIRRLRSKIEPNPSEPRYLLTVRGLGYKLVKGQDHK